MEIVGSIGFLIVMFVIAAVFLKGIERIRQWRRAVPAEETIRRAAEFNARLASPKWQDLERHFGAPAPADLRHLYESPLIRSEHLAVPNPTPSDAEREDHIARFLPADLLSVQEASWVVKTREFPFAEDGLGNYYTVSFRLDVTAPSAVRLHWHDGGDVEVIADSLGRFLSRARPRA